MIILAPQGQAEQVPAWEYDADLDDVIYRVRIEWIERPGAWYLSLDSADGTPLLVRRRLVLGADLSAGRYTPAWPAGFFALVDLSGSGVEPDYEALGRRVFLAYATATEVAEIAAEIEAESPTDNGAVELL